MAIYIQIVKVEETPEQVIYAFESANEVKGRVSISRHIGLISLLEISDEMRVEFYLPRVRRKLSQHYQQGEFPEVTCYAA